MSIDPSATIHASAVIEDGAVIGADCIVGPLCCVGAQVKLGLVEEAPLPRAVRAGEDRQSGGIGPTGLAAWSRTGAAPGGRFLEEGLRPLDQLLQLG